jgi:hypothetical protein
MVTLYLVAAPLPKPRPSKGPPVLVADNLRLELTPVGQTDPVGRPRDLLVRTTLHNLSNRQRDDLSIFQVSDPEEAHREWDSARLCVDLIIWFPDGRATYLWLYGSGTKFERQTVAPHASASAFMRGCKLGALVDDDVESKNGNRFCVIAVDGKRRLQSNTVSYNGCPLPPSTFDPFRYCPGTPEGDAHYEEVSRQRRERAKSNFILEVSNCAIGPIERVIPPNP